MFFCLQVDQSITGGGGGGGGGGGLIISGWVGGAYKRQFKIRKHT